MSAHQGQFLKGAIIVSTILGLLGTTHDPELRRRVHYPLSLLEQAIRAFRPDVILGEVMPESWFLLQQNIGYDAPDFITPASEYYDLIFPCASDRPFRSSPSTGASPTSGLTSIPLRGSHPINAPPSPPS